MKYFIICLTSLFSFINFVFCSSDENALAKWERYAYPKHEFEVSLPSKPNMATVNGDDIFEVSDSSGMFMIMVSQDECVKNFVSSKALKAYIKDKGMQVEVKEVNFSQLRDYIHIFLSQKLELGDSLQKDLTDKWIDTLIIVKGDKLYNLMCVGANPSMQEKICHKFFSSFNFLEENQNARNWQMFQFKGCEIAFPSEPKHQTSQDIDRYSCPLDGSTLTCKIASLSALENAQIDAYLLSYLKQVVKEYPLENVVVKKEDLQGKPVLAFRGDWNSQDVSAKMSGLITINNSNLFYVMYVAKKDCYDESVWETFKSKFKLINSNPS